MESQLRTWKVGYVDGKEEQELDAISRPARP